MEDLDSTLLLILRLLSLQQNIKLSIPKTEMALFVYVGAFWNHNSSESIEVRIINLIMLIVIGDNSLKVFGAVLSLTTSPKV